MRKGTQGNPTCPKLVVEDEEGNAGKSNVPEIDCGG